jgi:very-short-patch-repair endonuclease
MTAMPDLTELIAAQHGVFTRRQVRSLGVTAKRERRMVATRQWLPVLGPSYVQAGTPIGVTQRARAATLVGPGVAALHTAAELHGLAAVRDDLHTHVHVARGNHPKVRGLTAHSGAPIEPADVTTALGIPVTTRRRTAVDLSATLPWRPAVDLAREALFRRWITLDELAADARSRVGCHRTPQLVAILRLLGAGGRSYGELRLHQILRRAGIDGWRANVVLAGIGEVDVLFPRQRVVVEIDGYHVHSRREVFQRDRDKGNRLLQAGYRVLRFTWVDLTDRPQLVVTQIRQLLAA